MGLKHYILDRNKRVVELPDHPSSLIAWAMFYEDFENRRVATTDFMNGVQVSTVFLGHDHSLGGSIPLVFETMTFGEEEEVCNRYATWNEAVEGHEREVERIRATIPRLIPKKASNFP